jgi:hypothetical protein
MSAAARKVRSCRRVRTRCSAGDAAVSCDDIADLSSARFEEAEAGPRVLRLPMLNGID